MTSKKNILNTKNSKNIDLTDKFNYTLNGIEHQISLNSKISILCEPLDEKILISNKLLIKYLHDLFNLNNIEYFICYNTLMGYYVFEGIHLFKKDLYLCISDHHINKFLKLKEELKKDDFYLEEKDDYYIIKTSFFDKTYVLSYIFIIKNDENKKLIHKIDNIESKLDFYDIYPLQEKKYEEFTVFIPNKIENVLNSYLFNLNNIVFNKKDDILFNNTKNKNNLKNNNQYNNYNYKENKNIFTESLKKEDESITNSIISKILSIF